MRRPTLHLVSWAVTLAVVGRVGVAGAEPTYAVRVVSEPAGATVYVDDRQSEALGETPVEARLSGGPHTLILALEDHEEAIEGITVRKQKRRQTFTVELVAIEYALVEVVAEDGDEETEGADILVDGEAVGTVPGTIKIVSGPHQIEITKQGFDRYETWVELGPGEQTRVTVTLASAGGGDDDDDDGQDRGGVSTPRPPRTRPLVIARGGFEIGWRRWSYDNPRSSTARPFTASYVPLLRISAELYPLAARSGLVAGVGGLLSVALGMPPGAVADGITIDTSWSELEIGARFRYAGKPDFGLEGVADLAYGRTAFGFAATGTLADQTPDVDYRYLRLGAVGGYRSGKQLLFAGLDYLMVSSAGLVADRFRAASASGWAVRGGYSYRVRRAIDATVALSYRRFGHDFDSQAGDLVEADGGLDRFFGLTLGAVYSY